MAGLGSLLGALMQGGLSSSGGSRLGHAAGEQGLGGMLGGSGGGSDLLGGLASAARGGISAVGRNPMAAGGLGAMAGSLLGGGSGAARGALGGGAMALLAGLAFQALSAKRGGAPAGAQGMAPLGLREPESPSEAQELEATAELVLRGMVSAAKADGHIDNDEMQRIVGRLKGSGADDALQGRLLDELGRPLDLEALAREIPNETVAAEIYAASLFAIEVDTEAEREYLRRLAELTGLDAEVVAQLHRAVGVS